MKDNWKNLDRKYRVKALKGSDWESDEGNYKGPREMLNPGWGKSPLW